MQNVLWIPKKYWGKGLTTVLSRSVIKNDTLLKSLENRIEFIRKWAWGAAAKTYGYDATLLIDICDWFIQARKSRKLPSNYNYLAEQSEIIIRSVAKVWIIALVDEATWYQKQKDEYQKTLAMYIAEEMRPWVKTFKDEYYEQLYKLLDWDWLSFIASKKTHPQVIWKITNELVYNKLPNWVIQELERLNPKNEKWNRKKRHHQFLTESVGYRHLIEHIAQIIIVAKMYNKWQYKEFKKHFNIIVPDRRKDWQLRLEIPFTVDEYISNQDKEEPKLELSEFNKNLKKGLDYSLKNK